MLLGAALKVDHGYGVGNIDCRHFGKGGEHADFAFAFRGNSLVFEHKSCTFFEYRLFLVIVEVRCELHIIRKDQDRQMEERKHKPEMFRAGKDENPEKTGAFLNSC